MAEDAGLLAEFRAASGPHHHGCSTCRWIETQPNADILDQAFADREINTTVIHKYMVEHGFTLTVSPVHTHRQRKHRV